MNIQNAPAGKQVGPSRYMEIGLNVLVAVLLAVSIIGIAYVYGFNLETGNLLDNISAAVRAVGVDGGFFLGLYFSRRHWTREKSSWWDSVKAILAGAPWFVVAMIMAGVSWLSNALFVSGSTTIITQGALDQIGVTFIDAKQANWVIGGIPLLVILLYSLVPSRVQVKTDARTPEEIEQEAKQEAARIRAQNMVAAARAEGAGQRIRTVLGGLVGEALNLEEAKKHDEQVKQMRIALETAGYATENLNEEQVEIQAVARGVWDQAKNAPVKQKAQVQLVQSVPELTSVPTGEEAKEEESVEESWPVAELASRLGVATGTISYWMRPDFMGPTKIFDHEVVIVNGSKRIVASAISRLFRVKSEDKKAVGGKTTRNSLGRIPAVKAASNGNGKHPTSGPLVTEKLADPGDQIN